MSPARFRLAAMLVLIAALAILLAVQWRVATVRHAENAALRQQAAALAEEARTEPPAAPEPGRRTCVLPASCRQNALKAAPAGCRQHV